MLPKLANFTFSTIFKSDRAIIEQHHCPQTSTILNHNATAELATTSKYHMTYRISIETADNNRRRLCFTELV